MVVLRDPGSDADLDRDGLVVAPAVEISLLDALTSVFAGFAGSYASGFRSTLQIPDPTHRVDVHAALMPLLAPVSSRLLVAYRPLACGFVCKAPGAGALGWHQDIRVTRPGSRPALALWVPLVDVGAHNGGLAVRPRSHVFDGWRAVGDALAPDADALGCASMVLELSAGRPVIFHGALMHCSGRNEAATPRPAATALLVPTEEEAQVWVRRAGVPVPVAVPDCFFLTGDLTGLVERHATSALERPCHQS